MIHESEIAQLLSQIDSKKIEKWRKSLDLLENRINYFFKNRALLEAALIHKSAYFEDSEQSIAERLEFLGDSVLELAITEFLFKKFRKENEGFLTKKRSKIISKVYLNKKAREIGLAKYILVNEDEIKLSRQKQSSLTADTMESLFGAIFLDSSFQEAKYVIQNITLSNLEVLLEHKDLQNYKSLLQEFTHSHYGLNPEYDTIKESGPEHQKKFYVRVKVGDIHSSRGSGKSKKSAEQKAAHNLLKRLEVKQSK
ncbi:MAG TPA: ribonuclease III [Candidatus Cloacimonetes bacterium]|nr:ribonuclease III [Candidatus Cloacimonadota bacterium]HEX37395.1 ribonuclease III [Candidatus Cloacimonadota bacterium]